MDLTYHILVGSHTFNVSTLHFSPSNRSLKFHSSSKVGYHPTYIARHPTQSNVVISTIEQEAGELAVLTVDPKDGSTKVIHKVGCGGCYPCFITFKEDRVYVPNFFGPSLLSMVFSSTEPHLDSSTGSIVKFKYPHFLSPKAFPQEDSHPHQAVFRTPDELFVPDLGSDKVWYLTPGNQDIGEEPWEVRDSIDFPPGFGPYHMVLHENIMYIVGEFSTSILIFSLHGYPNSPAKLIKSVSTDAEGSTGGEILLIPSSPLSAPLIYHSRRDDPSPFGDPILIFSLATDGTSLKKEGEIRTGLKHVRGMAFGGENNQFLVAGGLLGGGIKVYERLNRGVEFNELAHLLPSKEVEEPDCFV